MSNPSWERCGGGGREEEMQETAMKPGESASVDGIEVRMMEMRMQLREDRKASFETTKPSLYVLHVSSCHVHFFPHSFPPRSTNNLLMDPGSPTISWFVLGIANDFEPSRDQETGPDAYGPSPLKSGPGAALLWKHGWGGKAGTCARSSRAGKHSETNLSSNPEWDHPGRTPEADMERQRPGKLEFMGIQWDGQPAALEEESV